MVASAWHRGTARQAVGEAVSGGPAGCDSRLGGTHLAFFLGRICSNVIFTPRGGAVR